MTQRRLARDLIVTLGIAAMSMQAMSAESLSSMLECRDERLLTADPSRVRQLAAGAGMDCREHERPGQRTLSCTGGQARAFGQAVKDFNLVQHTAARHGLLSVAFTGAVQRLGPALDRAREGLEPEHPLIAAAIERREDGVAELQCRTARSAGAQAAGSISGDLHFRGVEPMPAMRVCAAPVSDPRQPVCVQTRTGELRYRIDELPPGDYYVTAYATERNPSRLFTVHGAPLARCPDNASDCASHRLMPVSVMDAGERSGVRLDTMLERLPPPLSQTP